MMKYSFLVLVLNVIFVNINACPKANRDSGAEVVEIPLRVANDSATFDQDGASNKTEDGKSPRGGGTIYDNENCQCVPYYLCENDTDIAEPAPKDTAPVSGLGTTGDFDPDAIDFRDIAQSNLKKCGTYRVCCKNPLPEPPNTPAPFTDTDKVQKCGVRNHEGLANRVVNSNLVKDDTLMGEFPWQVAVFRRLSHALLFLGGGALIHTRFVLTTPHIFHKFPKEELVIRVGEYDLKSTAEQNTHEDVSIAEVIIHPDVDFRKGFNDIALLYLERDVTLAPNVLTICLPFFGEQFPEGTRCTVTGWGKDKFGTEGTYQNVMKVVDVPLVDNRRCEEQLKKTRLGPNFFLDTGFRCAGSEEGQDSCQGDGGGPLSCEKDGFYKLAGLVAWGVGCGKADVPAVYMDVTKYVPWIDTETAKRLGDDGATDGAVDDPFDQIDFRNTTRPKNKN